MEIIYKSHNKDLFIEKWEEYLEFNLSSYKYLQLNLEYFLYYAKNLINDKSFVAIENNKCVAIAFVPIEKNKDVISISIAEGYVFSPLSVEKRVEKKVYEEIDKICLEEKIDKVNFALDPLIFEYTDKFNILLEYNFIDTSTTDCIINLNNTEQDLWKNLRKSYKALINKCLKSEEFEVVIIDKSNKDYDIHELYRELHNKCAGGVTRDKKTFDKQFEMLENDYASILGLKYKDKFIGFNYFFHYQKTVIYASGADDPEYENSKIPIYHVILWSAIKYYKERGFDFIEFSQPCGYNNVQGFDDYLDDKQINISSFKRGMGTKMVPAFRGIKYFDYSLLANDIDMFKQQMIK